MQINNPKPQAVFHENSVHALTSPLGNMYNVKFSSRRVSGL